MTNFQGFRGLDWSIDDSSLNFKKLNNEEGFFVIDKYIDMDTVHTLSDELINENNLQMKHFNILESSPEFGQVRSPFINQEEIRRYLENPIFENMTREILVGNGIFHLFNGQVVSPTTPSASHNQSKWHRDFNKCHISNPALSYNILLMLGEYSSLDELTSPDTYHHFDVIKNSHLCYGLPPLDPTNVTRLRVKPGSLLVFNSSLWHRVVPTDTYQLFINAMLTEPYIKQQIEYLGTDFEWLLNNYGTCETEIARLLGYWSKAPESLSTFRKQGIRTYRSNQG